MLGLQVKRNVLRYAKMKAPYDTGNLRHNAIKGMFWNDPNYFRIHYSSRDAHYIEYLEEKATAGGSLSKANIHRNFILQTYFDLAFQLEEHYMNKKNMPKMIRMAKSEIQTNFRREIRHNQSLSVYQAEREMNKNG